MRSQAPAKKKQSREPVEVGKHMVMDPRVCFGRLTFKGTRVPVEAILVPLLVQGRTMEKILAAWTELKREAVEEALQLAAAAWPELMREDAEKALEPWTTALVNRNAARLKVPREPTRSGRPA
jgi:uncharacterized protein (DUF433 family)